MEKLFHIEKEGLIDTFFNKIENKGENGHFMNSLVN